MDEGARASAPDVTAVLNRALAGDRGAAEALYQAVYGELLALARGQLAGGGPPTLNPQALVHEAYLRMLRRDGTPMRDRRTFFAYAARAMRSVLVDAVRERAADKRGGGERPLTLTTGALEDAPRVADFGQLEEALSALRALDARCARVVELRYFGGLTEEDVAEELAVSVPTVKRDWRKARAFLFERLR